MTGPSWSQLDKLNAEGEGLIYYASGRVAVMVCKDRGLKVTTITADSDSGQILLSFNHLGVGSVEYPNGKPWLVVSEDGWSVSDRKGLIIERGKFPRKQGSPIECQVNENVVVTFQDRQNITATFTHEDVFRTFECGERLRRTEPYTVRVTGRRPGGKLELDVASIRQRQKDVGLSGSLYVPPGPHNFRTEHPGIGGLKSALRTMPASSPLTSTVQGLQTLDSRLDSIDLMPKPSYGSAAAGSLTGTLAATTATTTAATANSTGNFAANNDASPASTRRPSAATALAPGMPEDYGSPALSEAQQKLAHSIRPLDVHKQRHRAGRLKLAALSLAAATRGVLSATDAARDELAVLVLLADWSPACARLEASAQTANRQLVDEGTAAPASPSGHVKMYKVDASEGSLLQNRFGFRTVPMLLMFYEGRLVEATNAPRSPQEIKSLALDALTRARKGLFLPEGFSFNGKDNLQLDYIQPNWDMLGSHSNGQAGVALG